MFSMPASPQDATGCLRGTVLDASNSRIPQGSITIVNTATAALNNAVSDALGNFALGLLPPGDYSGRVVAESMSPRSRHNSTSTSVPSHPRIPPHHRRRHENVTVSAAPALVETQPAAVSTLLDERALNDLPLNGRRFSDLALFSPASPKIPAG